MSETSSRTAAGTERRDVDVVVVGAGFAGLCAADRLLERGLEVVVVEGRDRVGGRARTGEVAGVRVDLGATWLGPAHTAVRGLASRFGCELVAQHEAGANVLSLGGRRQTFSGTVPPVSPIVALDMGRIQWQLGRMATAVRLHEMWTQAEAAEWDSVTFGAWLRRQRVHRHTRSMMEIVTKVQWGCLPDDVSLLHVLRYIRAAGGLDTMLDVRGGNQQDRLATTTHELAARLAASLGDRVVLGAPVRRVEHGDQSVVVHADGLEVHARAAVLTVSPTHRASMTYDPPLPEVHRAMSRSWRLGALSKAFVAFERPTWRERGLSGESLSDSGPVFITFDVSPSADGPGIVMAFCDPRHFDHLAPHERRRQVTAQVAGLLDVPAASAVDYTDVSWGSDDFAPGGPNPAVPAGAWQAYGPVLREPVGSLFWAGSDVSDQAVGTIDGAVRSGWRAAEEVVTHLAIRQDSERQVGVLA